MRLLSFASAGSRWPRYHGRSRARPGPSPTPWTQPCAMRCARSRSGRAEPSESRYDPASTPNRPTRSIYASTSPRSWTRRKSSRESFATSTPLAKWSASRFAASRRGFGPRTLGRCSSNSRRATPRSSSTASFHSTRRRWDRRRHAVMPGCRAAPVVRGDAARARPHRSPPLHQAIRPVCGAPTAS